jgi:hypothetical protein
MLNFFPGSVWKTFGQSFSMLGLYFFGKMLILRTPEKPILGNSHGEGSKLGVVLAQVLATLGVFLGVLLYSVSGSYEVKEDENQIVGEEEKEPDEVGHGNSSAHSNRLSAENYSNAMDARSNASGLEAGLLENDNLQGNYRRNHRDESQRQNDIEMSRM